MSQIKNVKLTHPDRIGYWYVHDGLDFNCFMKGRFGDWLYRQDSSDFFKEFKDAKQDAYELFGAYKDKATQSRIEIRKAKKGDLK